jgi:CRP/FNR family transcriptional regulator, anaerobic regulatory protein
MNPSAPAFESFIAYFSKLVAPVLPSSETIQNIADASELLRVEAKDHVLRQGEVARHLYFVHSGLIRYYYLDAVSGEERTGQFFDANSVYTDMLSFLTVQPTTQFIQAIERTEIVCIPKHVISGTLISDHAIERFGRLALERALVGSQKRTASMMNQTLYERYSHFVKTRPELSGRVPQYLIASFLGVTPEALSRARRRDVNKL